MLSSARTPTEESPYVLKAADSETDSGLHGKALVLKILAFELFAQILVHYNI